MGETVYGGRDTANDRLVSSRALPRPVLTVDAETWQARTREYGRAFHTSWRAHFM